jgi:hypothetical protein
MKILIVSGAFYPELSPRSFRATELVKQFCRQGDEVTVLTHYQPKHHVPLIEEFGLKIIDLGARKFPEIPLSKNKLLSMPLRVLRRILLMLLEYPNIELMFQVKRKLRNLSGFDLLISVAVPHPIHWGVSWAKSKSHPIAKTWIADCGDPYMLNTLDSFKKLFYFKYFEKAWCRKADYITLPNIAMKEDYYPEFHDKIREITQGFKFEESEKFLKPYTPNEVPTFLFSGSFIPGSRDPQPLIRFLLEQKVNFKFHIFTQTRGLINPFMEQANGKIELHDYIPREALLAFQSQMDFLVNIGYDPQKQLPSKLIDYYITGRPILNLNTESLDVENIRRFLKGDYSEKLEHPKIDQYRIEKVCNKFLAIKETEKSYAE